MPGADVVVIGAGLSGLTAALAAAQSGARVQVLARGHAGTHWGTGGLDIAAAPGSTTPLGGLRVLAAKPGHPYGTLRDDVAPALDWLRQILSAQGLTYEGDLDSPLALVPTSIGGTRLAAILPAAQAPALRPWASGERLVVCGIAGFKFDRPANTFHGGAGIAKLVHCRAEQMPGLGLVRIGPQGLAIDLDG